MQQDVGRGFIAQVGYVGGEGHHLFDKYTVNLINPATGLRLVRLWLFRIEGTTATRTQRPTGAPSTALLPWLAVPGGLHVVPWHCRRLHRLRYLCELSGHGMPCLDRSNSPVDVRQT